MSEIVLFATFRDHLGVGAADPEVPAVQRLYDAIGEEIERITNRTFTAAAATYTEVLRLHGADEFTVAHVPVASITSIAKHNFDGTDEAAYEEDRYRLEDADRGRIRIKPSPEYAKVVYATTGEIPHAAVQAYLEWGKARWDERDQAPSLTSYQTGEDAEGYSVTLAGKPPRSAVVALLGLAHVAGGGPV